MDLEEPSPLFFYKIKIKNMTSTYRKLTKKEIAFLKRTNKFYDKKYEKETKTIKLEDLAGRMGIPFTRINL